MDVQHKFDPTERPYRDMSDGNLRLLAKWRAEDRQVDPWLEQELELRGLSAAQG